jgi:phosphatidylserine decarboxylase
LRITQFYSYFNQPELLALQNPVSPESGAFLTPLSLWMREFAMNYGKFLEIPESAQHLDSYRFGPE